MNSKHVLQGIANIGLPDVLLLPLKRWGYAQHANPNAWARGRLASRMCPGLQRWPNHAYLQCYHHRVSESVSSCGIPRFVLGQGCQICRHMLRLCAEPTQESLLKGMPADERMQSEW